MNYQETLEYINQVSYKGSVPGLTRVRELLRLIGNPQKQLKFIHIGGTNGKGSTAAFLSTVLVTAGYKTGLFISPYIEEFNERMQINNQNISDDELAEIATYIRPFAESMEDEPTEFELYTAICMEYYARNHCDIVVLEVGMGGEFDATNVIDAPEIAVITAIGLDHTEQLGDTIEKIATTKSKIIKPGCSAVLYKQSDEATDVIRARCEEVGADLYISEPEKLDLISVDLGSQQFNWPGYGELSIPLVGHYQLGNVSVVLKVIEVLNKKGYNLTPDIVREGLARTYWPGRFEVIMKHPIFVVDGAHNPHGIRATAEGLGTVFKDEKLYIIFGVMADKDYDEMLDVILPFAKEVLAVTPDNTRALPADRLAEIIRAKGVSADSFDQLTDAIDTAIDRAGQDGIICAIGSLYMIGDIKKYIKKKKMEKERQ